MIEFRGKLVLLDIEGTVSPLAFVHEVMFPYARKHAAAWLRVNWGDEVIARLARDVGVASFIDVPDAEAAVHRLMDADAKVTGLKQLQGRIWEQGFRCGDLCSTLFEDVLPALEHWREEGIHIRIYSSGSIHAQRLFFAHTTAGDLTPRFSGYYDTTTGSKKEATSYTAIATDCGLPASEILFVSDLVDELNAAQTAGMITALILRPGNKPQPKSGHLVITTFTEIVLP